MPIAMSNMVVSLAGPSGRGSVSRLCGVPSRCRHSRRGPTPWSFLWMGPRVRRSRAPDKRVIVTSVETSQFDGPGGPSEKFELTFDNLNDLIPQEPDTTQNSMPSMRMGMGPGMGMRPGMIGGMAGMAGRHGVLQELVQVISTKGRRLLCQTSLDERSRRLRLTTVQLSEQGSPKEIRIFIPISIRSSIPFEFHDLPMP